MVGSLSSNPSDREALGALSARERVRLVGTALVLPVTLVLLKALGYQRTLRLGERLSRRRPVPADAAARAASTSRLVWVAHQRLHLPGSCLSRSLALWYLLRLQGVPTEIQLGVRGGGEPLDAHAWVVHEGVALNDYDDVADRYAVFRPRNDSG